MLATDIAAEFAGVHLGDTRLDERVVTIAERLAKNPAVGFPRALVTEKESEAFYRFVRNPKVELLKLLEPHKLATRARCAEARDVIVAVDISEMAFQGSTRGDLDDLSATTQGFKAIFALAMARDRTPLGILDVTPLPKGSVGREASATWMNCVESAVSALGSDARVVVVMDREADAFASMATLIGAGRSFVIRAEYDRLVNDGAESMRKVVARAPVALEREVALSRRVTKGRPPTAKKRHPERRSRTARLAVRACAVRLPRPPKADRTLPDFLDVNVIHVTELAPPEGEAPVDWLLLTSEPIETEADIARAIDAYRARWVIEEYFKALKTGCAYEERELEGRNTLLVALGLLVPIAWQLLALRSLAREAPDEPAERVLTATQILLLQRSEDTKLAKNPTAGQALLAIARLGGHLRQNGPPGWLILWRGMATLRAWEDGFRLARPEPSPESTINR